MNTHTQLKITLIQKKIFNDNQKTSLPKKKQIYLMLLNRANFCFDFITLKIIKKNSTVKVILHTYFITLSYSLLYFNTRIIMMFLV